MHILLTGAGGFCGGFLTRYLAKRGVTVHAVTRRSPVVEPPDRDACARIDVINSDLRETSGFPSSVHAIIHTAATSPADGVTTDMMVEDNVIATRSLIRYGLRARARLFVMFSSISVYGVVNQSVLDEETPILNPDDYGITKLLGERLLRQHAETLPSLVLRLPGIVGPGSRRNWLSMTFQKLRAGQPLEFFNPDADFNNAVHVADLADLIERQLARPHSGHAMAVLGAEGHLKVREVVDLLRGTCSSVSPITIDERARSSFVIGWNWARENLGYRPMRIDRMLRRFASENLDR